MRRAGRALLYLLQCNARWPRCGPWLRFAHLEWRARLPVVAVDRGFRSLRRAGPGQRKASAPGKPSACGRQMRQKAAEELILPRAMLSSSVSALFFCVLLFVFAPANTGLHMDNNKGYCMWLDGCLFSSFRLFMVAFVSRSDGASNDPGHSFLCSWHGTSEP